MIARVGLAPVGQYALEPTALDVRHDKSFGNVCQPVPGKGGFDHLGRGVERQLAVHPDVELAAILLELPGIHVAAESAAAD